MTDQLANSMLNRVLVALAFFAGVISWSPLFFNMLGLKTAFLYIPISVTLIFAFLAFYRNSIREFLSLIFIHTYLIIFLFLTMSEINLSRFSSFAIVLCVAWYFSKDQHRFSLFTDFFTWYVLSALLLSWISFFYALTGGGALFEFANVDGRINKFYLFSLSNSAVGDVIRASFIYDEPGAFSFVICCAAICRELLGRSRLLTAVILCFGLVTLSFMHVIAVAIYFIMKLKSSQRISFGFLIVLALFFTYGDDRFDFLYDRFDSQNTNSFFWNRSIQVENFLVAVQDNPEILLWGNYACYSGSENECLYHGDITSSPVTPIYEGGIWYFSIQLATYVLLFFLALNKRFLFSAILIGILLLQRPFFHLMGYQYLIYIPIYYMYHNRNN